MLIDDLLNCKEWKEAGVISPSLRTRLAKAPKFILRCDFAMAVDELTHNGWSKTCDKIVPLCRLPFQECWVEVAHTDRLAYRQGVSLRKYEFKIKRVGWLLTEVGANGAWSAQMFWTVDTRDPSYQESIANSPPGFWGNTPISAALASIQFDPQAATADEAIGALGVSDFAENTVRLTKKPLNLEGVVTDWEGEGSFVMATLTLINSRNVTEYTPVSFEKKNKAAAKAGQSLLYDHKVISIHTRYSKRNLKSDASDGHKFRAHWCRGHFKIRKTGIFFWSPHRRGSLDLGPTRPKDYHVTL